MLFWIVAGGLAALVAVLLARPLLRPGAEGTDPAPDKAIYRDQLAEVDRDLARGVLAPAEAERARTEIARRLLAADRAGAAAITDAPEGRNRAAIAIVIAVLLGTLLMYFGSASFLRSAGFSETRITSLKERMGFEFTVRRVPLHISFVFEGIGSPGQPDLPLDVRLAEAQRLYASRPSQAEAEAEFAAAMPADLPEPPEDVRATIEQLRAASEGGEADADSLVFLAFVEMRLGDAAEAARVQRLAIEKKGDAATLEDRARLLDYMVAGAQGRVTPEAEEVLGTMRAADEMAPAVLYYSGLLFGTTGRPDEAFPFWRALVERAGAEDPYRQMAAGAVEDLAWMAGVDYTLPTAASAGPTPEQMAAAADMTPEERDQMIRGMVDQLSARLASSGGSPEDWARLISSLGVLGDTEQAAAILAEARTAFAASPEAQALLDQAATSAGLAE